jgi:hypothetical protein
VKIVKYKSLHFLRYTYLFNRFDYKPNIIVLLPYLFFSLVKGKHYRKNLIRSYEVNRINSFPEPTTTKNQPSIEILVNSTSKDFKYLNTVINRAVANSYNDIAKISITVPKKEINACRILLLENKYKNKIEVKSENDILNDRITNKIKEHFPQRYGWVLQQFLTIEQVINSQFAGVLQVNSDTLILKPFLWLDNNGNQPLFVASEYNFPYYQLLNEINNKFPIETYSHITHHMMFQPRFLQAIMNKSCLNSTEHLLDVVLENYDRSAASPICIEFEFYALGILTYFPENAIISKFSNVSLKLKPSVNNVEFESIIKKLSKMYNSVSIHSYLQI